MGGLGGASVSTEGSQDRFEDTVAIVSQLVVPDAENAKTLALELGVSDQVPLILCVLTSVKLDNQVPPEASEVGDIAGDGNLAPKAIVQEAAITKKPPKCLLVRSLSTPQGARERSETR
jgi:hypothetical protein